MFAFGQRPSVNALRTPPSLLGLRHASVLVALEPLRLGLAFVIYDEQPAIRKFSTHDPLLRVCVWLPECALFSFHIAASFQTRTFVLPQCTLVLNPPTPDFSLLYIHIRLCNSTKSTIETPIHSYGALARAHDRMHACGEREAGRQRATERRGIKKQAAPAVFCELGNHVPPMHESELWTGERKGRDGAGEARGRKKS